MNAHVRTPLSGATPTLGCAYAALGVAKSATAEEIRAAYYAAAKVSHPDVIGVGQFNSHEFQSASQAWAVLRAPARRKLYDRGEIDMMGRVTERGRRRRRMVSVLKSTTLYFAVPVAAGSLGLAALIGMPESIAPSQPAIEVVAPVAPVFTLREFATLIDEARSEPPPTLLARPLSGSAGVPTEQTEFHAAAQSHVDDVVPVKALSAGHVPVALPSAMRTSATTDMPPIDIRARTGNPRTRSASSTPRVLRGRQPLAQKAPNNPFASLFTALPPSSGSRSRVRQAASDHPFGWKTCDVSPACRRGEAMCGC